MAKKWIIYSLLAFSACTEQPLPEVEIGQPIFSFEGEMAGQAVKLVAGEAGDFMHTGYDHLPAGLWEFRGSLGPEGCPSCPGTLSLFVRDDQARSPSERLLEGDAPQVGAYSFYEVNTTEIFAQVSFQWESQGMAPSHLLWDLGDGTISEASAPVHEYRDSTLRTVEVCLTATNSDGCSSQVCNIINLKDTLCQAAFQYVTDPASPYVLFFDQSKGALPLKYTWRFGDGYEATLGNPGYYYASQGQYEGCLHIEDQAGCESEVCKVIANDPTKCEAGFGAKVRRLKRSDPFQWGAVTLQWRDEQGKLYRSDLHEQPAGALFLVKEATRYQANARGEATWKLRAEMDLSLYDESGNSIRLKGSAVLAVGIPLE